MSLNLFDLPGLPREEMIAHLAAPGFGCRLVSCERMTVTDDDGNSWNHRIFHCQSRADHPCSPFWVQLDVDDENDLAWSIAVGDIVAQTVYLEEEEEETVASSSSSIRIAYTQKTEFRFASRAAVEIAVAGHSPEYRSSNLDLCGDQMCSWLARGCFFMGLDVEIALKICEVHASEHEKMEWYKAKQLADVVYRTWAPIEEAKEREAFASLEQYDHELGKNLIAAHAEMEKILGGKVPVEEMAKCFDTPTDVIVRIMDAGRNEYVPPPKTHQGWLWSQ